jgi:homoserine kinase
MGGATVAWTSHDGPRAATLEVDASVVVTALIPDEFLATDKARAILPASVPISDAIFNASRAALLVEALARRPELLFDATEDRLHQGYRADIMPASTEIMGALRAEGFAAVISGAGPTVLVLTDAAKVRALDGLVTDLIDGLPGWRAIRPTIDTRGAVARRAPEVG